MKHRFSLLAAFVVTLLGLVSASSARSQVVVYSVDFKHEDGFNLDFFDGGYFVAPALGGTGTFILTAHEGAIKTVTSSASTGNFFHGVDEHGTRMSVVSAAGGDGTTSNASYVAFGEVSGSVELVTTDATYKIKIAKKLKGHAIAASSEANTTSSSSSSSTDTSTSTGTSTGTTTTDTSTSTTTDTSTGTGTSTTGTSSSSTSTTSSLNTTIGFANVSSMSLAFDEGHTKTSNKLNQTLEQTSASLVLELQQHGYVDSASSSTSTSTGTSTGTSTSTGTTTGAAPEIGVSSTAGNIADGGAADFGSVTVGGTGGLTFIISNTGGADLTGLTTTIDGTDAADFTVTVVPASPVVGPTGTTSFSVQFAPSSAGARTAAIHIANNDSNENPYDITLTGTGN